MNYEGCGSNRGLILGTILASAWRYWRKARNL